MTGIQTTGAMTLKEYASILTGIPVDQIKSVDQDPETGEMKVRWEAPLAVSRRNAHGVTSYDNTFKT